MLADKSSSAGRLLFLFFRHARARSLLCVRLHRRNNFCGQLIAEDSTSAKWAHPFHRHSRWLYMLLSSSFRVQHCFFFFFFFFFNFSGHSLCSEHCSQLEHCVASVFSVYIIIPRFSSFFFYLFIYLFPDKDVFKRLNFWEVYVSLSSEWSKVFFFSLNKKTVWWTWNCEKDTTAKTHQETVTSYLKLPLLLQSTLFHAALLAAWNLFLPSTIALFNSLPSSVVSCSSKSGFTRAQDCHFSSDKFSFGLSWPSFFFFKFFLFFFCFFFLLFSFLLYPLYLLSIFVLSSKELLHISLQRVLLGNPCKTYQ